MSALQLHVYTSPTRAIRGPGERTFSPVTSTLICGVREAVLVDAGFIKEDVDALGDMIAGAGRRLTTLFVTHGHSDHYFGAGRLAERFPGVRVVAAPGVIDAAPLGGDHHAYEFMGDRNLVVIASVSVRL